MICLLYTSTALHNLREAMMRYETSPDYLAEIVRDQLHLPSKVLGAKVPSTFRASPWRMLHF